MKKIIYLTGIFFLIGIVQNSNGQPSFILPDESGTVSENICVPVTVADFTQFKSIEFDLFWDATVLEYSGAQNWPSNFPNLDLSSFDLVNFNELDFTWLGYDCAGNTGFQMMIDGDTLFEVCFNLIGNEGDFSPIIIENPIVTRENAGCLNIGALFNNGTISILPPCLPTFWVDTSNTLISAVAGETYCFDIYAKNFKHNNHFSYSLEYEEFFGGAVSVQNFQIPNLNEQNFDLSQSGIISMSWQNNQHAGFNPTDSIIIHQICFESEVTQTVALPTITFSPTLFNQTALTIANSCMAHNICGSNFNGSIEIITAGGLPPYNFIWTGPNGFFSTAEEIQNLESGTYYLVITDSNEDNFTADFEILNIDDEETVSITICELNCQVFGNPLPCEDGIYQNIATDNGCSNVTYTIQNVIASDAPNNTLIFGESVYIQNEQVVTVSFRVKNFNNILAIQFALGYDENELNIISTEGDIPGSASTMIHFDTNNPNLILLNWFDANANGITLPDSTIIVELTFEILNTFEESQIILSSFLPYEIIDGATEEAICANFQPASIYQSCPLIQSITPDTILCDPFEFQLEVIAPDAVAYEWFPSDNLSCFDCPNPVTMPFFSEFYTVIVTDANGCTDEASVFVEIPFGLDWSLFPWTNSPVCEGETLQFMSEVPVNVIAYEWEGPNGFSSTNPAPVIENITMAEAGIYSVTVTSVGGCTGVADFDVIVNESPVADAGPNMILNCIEASVTLGGSGSSMGADFTYLWTNSSGFELSDLLILEVDIADTYTLNVISTNSGCISSDEVEVFVDATLPVVSIDIPDFCIGSSFSICPTVNGGSGDFSYFWTTPSGANIFTACPSFTDFSTDDIGLYDVVITDNQSGCSAVETYFLSPLDCVWPGDTDTNKVVNNFDLLNIGLAFDATGPIRENASLNWEGQPAENWTELTPDGINYKHVDCDGNGIINADDTLAITQNWGLTHNLWAADDRDMGAPFYVERDTFVQDTTYAIPVILGEEDFPAEEVYGIAFTLVIDTSLVASDASINFENSWLGGINDDMIAIQKTTLHSQGGRIDAAVTRIDGQNMTGFGQMGTFFITIEDIIFQAPPGGEVFNVEKELIFKIENVKMIGFDGEIIAVNTDPQPSISTNTTTAFLNSQIHVFPNPMSDILTIHSPNILMEKVEVFNIAGQSVIAIFEKNSQLILNTNNWQSGTYFIKIQTPEGIILKKAVK